MGSKGAVCLLKRPNLTLRDTRSHSFSGVWKWFKAFLEDRGLLLPLGSWLLLNSASGRSWGLGWAGGCYWLAALRFGLGENRQAAELPLCSTTNTGKKRHSERLPNAAKIPPVEGLKTEYKIDFMLKFWVHVLFELKDIIRHPLQSPLVAVLPFITSFFFF